ncbi:hypothetical protein FQN51_003439 [Onygenales sp. PD_10]|nr:hypothetical protein FQN51_003439 [Onygenales sp. PD_10]
MSSFTSLQGNSIDSSLRGAYIASPVKCMLYGRGCINSLPAVISELGASKAYIITGTSLREKTPVIKEIEDILKRKDAHAGTYSGVRQHAPIADIHAAIAQIKHSGADVLVSVGGGSPIDAAKAVAYNLHQQTGRWVYSIAVPTTVSVAETTKNAGFTNEAGDKVGVAGEELVPRAVLYDGDIALHTPLRLWLSSAIRALDHALELLYHPSSPETPTKHLALSALSTLSTLLPQCHAHPHDADIRQKLFLAGYSSLFPFQFSSGALGLSHSIGHAIGSPYGIPHGITSCITLGKVVGYLAERGEEVVAGQIARGLGAVGGGGGSGDVRRDAREVGRRVQRLVGGLGLGVGLGDYNVPPGEEEVIALRVLKDREHPDFKADSRWMAKK